MKSIPFTRPTIISAIEFLAEMLSQAKFDQLIFRLELERYVSIGSNKSVTSKSSLLSSAAIEQGTQILCTLDGPVTLAEAVVREAVRLTNEHSTSTLQQRFLRGLALDGYTVNFDANDGSAVLRSALPIEINLPSADDEVHYLLRYFDFQIPLGHLDQAIDAHTRGDWAAANSQIRTFLEGLLDAIAFKIDPLKFSELQSSENRRAWLADVNFLSVARNEWSRDGKNYLNGLFKMLHTEGSHPGLSNDDHCTFRLHLSLTTSRVLLRRLRNNC